MRLPEFREFKARTLDKAESIKHKKLVRGRKAADSGRLDFDKFIQLPGKPLGFTHIDGGFLTTNKVDPWGFINIAKGKKGSCGIDKVMVQEQMYMQKVGFNAVTWNGKTFVSYTDGTWFQKQG